MAKVIKKSEEIFTRKYIAFFYIKELNKTFEFECGILGYIDATSLLIEDYNNYKLCLKYNARKEIREFTKEYVTNVLIQCDCFNEFYLSRPITYCTICGEGYHKSGIKLNKTQSVKVAYTIKIEK